MRRRFSWLLAGTVALAVSAQALPATADGGPGDPGAPKQQITVTEHKVTAINGYHGGQKAEMDALAGGKQPAPDPKNPWDGFTLTADRAQAQSYVVPSEYGYLRQDYYGYPAGYRPGSILKVTVKGDYTAVDVTAPEGSSPADLAAAVRAKEKVPAGEPLLDTLGKEGKFVRIHETYTYYPFLPGGGFPGKSRTRTDVTTYLPWTLTKWSRIERKDAFTYSTALQLSKEKVPDYLVPMIDELQDRCEGVDSVLCKMPASRWADIIARSDQVVDSAKDLAEYVKAPKATATHALTSAQAGKTLTAADDAVNATVKRLAKGKPAPKTPDFVPTSMKGWAVALSATALRAHTTFGDSSSTALDKAESLLAAVPLVGEAIGFSNALIKKDPEGMIINIISLATLGAMSACPPAALVGGIILAGHALVRGLMSLFTTEPVTVAPVNVALEQARKGSVLAWTAGVPKNPAPSKLDPPSAEPLVANSFTITAKDGYAFNYSGTTLGPSEGGSLFDNIVTSVRARVWQDGFPLYNIECKHHLSRYGTHSYDCESPAPTVVEPKHPVQVQLLYTIGQKSILDESSSESWSVVPYFSGQDYEIYPNRSLGTYTLAR